MRIVSAFIVLGVVGCAATPTLSPSAGVQQTTAINQAWAACQLQAMQVVPVGERVISGPILANLERNKMARLCMQAAGYQMW